jgi:hypothetical protein
MKENNLRTRFLAPEKKGFEFNSELGIGRATFDRTQNVGNGVFVK